MGHSRVLPLSSVINSLFKNVCIILTLNSWAYFSMNTIPLLVQHTYNFTPWICIYSCKNVCFGIPTNLLIGLWSGFVYIRCKVILLHPQENIFRALPQGKIVCRYSNPLFKSGSTRNMPYWIKHLYIIYKTYYNRNAK